MRTESETNLIITVTAKELEVILAASKIEDEFISDYIKDTIMLEAMRTVKRHEQEETK